MFLYVSVHSDIFAKLVFRLLGQSKRFTRLLLRLLGQQMDWKKCIFFSKISTEAPSDVSKAMIAMAKMGSIEERQLQFESYFWKQIPSWLQDNLGSTCAALVSLNLLNDIDFINKKKDDFVKFVRSCFKGDTNGGYSNVPDKEEKGSVFGTAYAVEVLRYALDKKENEKLITNGSIEQLTDKEIKSIEGFLGACRRSGEKDNKVPLRDKPEGGDSILVIYLVRRLLWTLNKENEFFNLISKKDIGGYLNKCYQDGGFKSSPSVNTLDISTTFFALSLIDGKKPYERILPEMRKEFFEEKKNAIYAFLEKCWDSQRGGFKPSIEPSLPTLKDTHFALQILDLLGRELEAEKIPKMKEFVGNCYCKGGGFKFSKEDFLPSAHATRCALQIDDWFLKHNKADQNDTFLDGVTTIEIIDSKKKEETKSFLHNKLYNKDTGGYSGYPLSDTKDIMKCPLLRQTYNSLTHVGTQISTSTSGRVLKI